jgi:intergrase/recombinase
MSAIVKYKLHMRILGIVLNRYFEHGIPESVSDFIQGRASVTVGSAHYLAKTNKADLWYSKVIPTLIDVLS